MSDHNIAQNMEPGYMPNVSQQPAGEQLPYQQAGLQQPQQPVNTAYYQQQPAYVQPPHHLLNNSYYQQPYYRRASYLPAAQNTSFLGLNTQDTQFWKGALIGAAVTLLVTNDTVQKGLVRTVSKVTAAAQCGIEEMKEKFEDAKAEVKAENHMKTEQE